MFVKMLIDLIFSQAQAIDLTKNQLNLHILHGKDHII